MPTDLASCSSCGARLKADATVCDLCGTAVAAAMPHAATDDMEGETNVSPPVVDAPSPVEQTAEGAPSSGVFCNACGWKNPPASRFCSQCGEKLQEGVRTPVSGRVTVGSKPTERPAVPASLPPQDGHNPEKLGIAHGSENEKAVSRQVGILVGAGVLLVVVLFMITAVSKQPAATPPSAAATGTNAPATSTAPLPETDAPLPAQVAQRIEELRAQAEAAPDAAGEIALRTQMVNLLEGSGRLDLAAAEQQLLAETENTADAWRHAGNLYYDWMSTEEHTEHKIPIAEQAIAAYQKVLALEPNNLDARTDMAVAYLSTNNPMQGVEEISAVLAVDSTHIPARFNYGVMLAMIGRIDKAQTQFEAVKELVADPASPYYQRADAALTSLTQAGP